MQKKQQRFFLTNETTEYCRGKKNYHKTTNQRNHLSRASEKPPTKNTIQIS
ncbi:hypothetical protein Bca4012_029290 [Brassica carinata]